MPYATDAKLFRYTDGGAPTLNGAAGSLLNLLDACLRTGYNIEAPTSITRSGATVTVTFASAHGYTEHQVIQVSGANETDYNGLFRITSVTTLALTYELAAGITPTTPATGTFETKVAPAGWTRLFTGTNKGVYKSADVGATGCCLRIDDTNSATRRGVVRGYISMSDVDTGIEPFPASASLYWYKGSDDGTTRAWFLAADSMTFYIGMSPTSAYGDFHGFGDFPSYKPGDIYNCFLSGSPSASDDTANYADSLGVSQYPRIYWFNAQRLVVARNYAGIESSPTQLNTVDAGMGTAGVYSAAYTHLRPLGGSGMTYPHPVDNGILYGNVFFQEQNVTMNLVRGYPPGLYDPWHPVIQTLNAVTLITGAPQSGRKALLWRTRVCSVQYAQLCGPGTVYCYNVASEGNPMIDVTGPWR